LTGVLVYEHFYPVLGRYMQMAKLTSAGRKRLAPSTFAIPSKREYPIPDLAHARDADSRVAANGSPAEVAAVHHAVAAKFPELAARSEAIHKAARHSSSKSNSPHQPS
jgi:hypothetical protein